MERMITKELLIDLASKVLQEMDRNDCRLLSVSRPPADEDLTDLGSVGSATLGQIAPVWCVDFICEGLEPLIVRVQDKPGVTDSIIRNELMVKLGQYATAARRATAIHEAGHAVVAHVLGRRIMYAALLTDQWGETMPMCSVCDTCLDYYSKNNPANNTHSKHIQDDLRCDMAIALAGEIAQRDICGNQNVDERELAKDRSLAKEKASAIHLWKDCVCWQYQYEACQICSDYRDIMKHAVETMVAHQDINKSILALAELLEARRTCERTTGAEIEELLKKMGLTKGSEMGSLPSAPLIERMNSMQWKKLTLNDEQVSRMKHRYIADRFMAEYRDLLGPKRFTLLLGNRIERQQMPIYFSPDAISRCKALIESYPNEECAQPEASTMEECYGDCSGYDARFQQIQ